MLQLLTESPLIWPYALLLGLIIGSYLNLVIYRLPLGLSTVRPASHCIACEAKVAARDNVPVLGYLLLRGRCRSCGVGISPRYPIVEASTGLLFVACVARFGPTSESLVAALFCSLMVALALIDVDHFILPNELTYGGLVVALLIHLVQLIHPIWPRTTLIDAILGAAAGAAFILVINGLWWLVRRVQGFGLGDAKMLAMMGAFLGIQGTVVAVFVATMAGGMVGLFFIARRKLDLGSKLPFGSFLGFGGLVALFVGPEIVRWYLGFYA